jgi:hypothetical protein
MHRLKSVSRSCRISAGVILALGLVSVDGGDCAFFGSSGTEDGGFVDGVVEAPGVAVSGTASGSAMAATARTSESAITGSNKRTGQRPFRLDAQFSLQAS